MQIKNKQNNKYIQIRINQEISFLDIFMRGKKSHIVFLPGCAFMKYGKNMIENTLGILRKYEPTIEACSICCSRPSEVLDEKYRLNYENKIVKFLSDREVKKIYLACPNCFERLNKIVNDHNLNIEINMIYDLVEKFVEDNSDKNYPTVNNTLVLHDPCAIRRDIKTQTNIRNILKYINQDYNEPEYNLDKTICCGNIKMLHITNKSESKKLTALRIKQLKDKSDMVVSYCSGCIYSFKNNGMPGIHVMELLLGKVKNINYINRIVFAIGLSKC